MSKNDLLPSPDLERFCPPNCDHKWDKRCQLSCYEPEPAEETQEDPNLIQRLDDLGDVAIKAAYAAGIIKTENN
jgi:hypothetical protein